MDIFGIEGWPNQVVKCECVAFLEFVCSGRNIVENLLGGATRVGGDCNPGHDTTFQARHAHHEKLIEVAGKNG